MKKRLALLGLAAVLLITGCGEKTEADKQREHEIRMAKIESGQDLAERQMHHERQMAYIAPRPVSPVPMGTYIDYRGNPAYGHWDAFGNWVWHDPNGIYAAQTRHYLDYQIATGAMTAAALTAVLTRDAWERDHRNGWKQETVVVNNYISSDGKKISKSEYDRREAAAKKRRKAWKKQKAEAKKARKAAKKAAKKGTSVTTTTTTTTTTTKTTVKKGTPPPPPRRPARPQERVDNPSAQKPKGVSLSRSTPKQQQITSKSHVARRAQRQQQVTKTTTQKTTKQKTTSRTTTKPKRR